MTARSFKPADPAWQGKEQRNAVRIVVDWAASVAAEKFGTKPVRITDCTNRVCRIETDLAITVGTFIHIAVPEFTDVTGWVAWSSADAIGVDFSHPLPSRVLEYLIERNDPFYYARAHRFGAAASGRNVSLAGHAVALHSRWRRSVD